MEPVYEHLHQHLPERDIIHADELPCQVLKEEGKTGQFKSYIWLHGSTQVVSDKLLVAANTYSGVDGTKLAVVRYGNLGGSCGSVIPFFRNIID